MSDNPAHLSDPEADGIVDSGVTTLSSTDTNLTGAKTLAQTLATGYINAILPYNLVSGIQPTLVGSPTITYLASTNPPPNSNPQITVTLQVAHLPVLFSRIWKAVAPTARASATAEAYNPANIAPPQPFTPIWPRSVKPWLIANQDPQQSGNPFVN
jgi:hypothetical protein